MKVDNHITLSKFLFLEYRDNVKITNTSNQIKVRNYPCHYLQLLWIFKKAVSRENKPPFFQLRRSTTRPSSSTNCPFPSKQECPSVLAADLQVCPLRHVIPTENVPTFLIGLRDYKAHLCVTEWKLEKQLILRPYKL